MNKSSVTTEWTTFKAVGIETRPQVLVINKYSDPLPPFPTIKALNNTPVHNLIFFHLPEINTCWFCLVLKKKLENKIYYKRVYFSGVSQSTPSQNSNHST